MLCPRAGLSLLTQEPRLQFYRRQVFHRKLRNQGCSSDQRQVFHCKLRNQGCISAKDRSSIANLGNKAAILLGMIGYGSFPLLCAQHSLLSVWTNLKRSEKLPGAPTWRSEEWIWLTGPFGLHRNSPRELNTGFWPDQRSGNQKHPSPPPYGYRPN